MEKGRWVPDGKNVDTGKQYFKWVPDKPGERTGPSVPPDNFSPQDNFTTQRPDVVSSERRHGRDVRNSRRGVGNYNADLTDPQKDD